MITIGSALLLATQLVIYWACLDNIGQITRTDNKKDPWARFAQEYNLMKG